VLVSQELLNVASLLSISAEVSQHSLVERTPPHTLEKDINDRTTALLIGRHRLPVHHHKQLDLRPQRTYVLHPPALRLLSRIATCLVHNEPVLLVGETGTGKTSLISHVSSMLNQSLISINLSLQTEVSELLGGLKPIDASFVGFEIYNKFIELFDTTFSRKKNTKFQDMLRKAMLERKWKKVVVLWRQALELVAEKQAR
jgi:midasin